ncbi:hypothetical protein AGLY_007185 [Aphis glycines]|uniref:Uncharacterized protein n=1 Tax=Aphis glycines TaxID=307491 RepID=A0A6G0TNV4_APHGL|nr:hypothetical protein AGLY_007185 [Aphis glycines]
MYVFDNPFFHARKYNLSIEQDTQTRFETFTRCVVSIFYIYVQKTNSLLYVLILKEMVELDLQMVELDLQMAGLKHHWDDEVLTLDHDQYTGINSRNIQITKPFNCSAPKSKIFQNLKQQKIATTELQKKKYVTHNQEGKLKVKKQKLSYQQLQLRQQQQLLAVLDVNVDEYENVHEYVHGIQVKFQPIAI